MSNNLKNDMSFVLNEGFKNDFRSQMESQINVAVREAGLASEANEGVLDVAIKMATRFALGWVEAAAQFHENELYYRGLLVKIGETLGNEAYICDDGGWADGVLVAKVPELVQTLVNNYYDLLSQTEFTSVHV